MSSYRTATAPTPEFHRLSGTAVPTLAVLAERPQTATAMVMPIVWRGVDEGRVQRITFARTTGQGARIVDFGGCDVTDIKFSTRTGPPFCSPPV